MKFVVGELVKDQTGTMFQLVRKCKRGVWDVVNQHGEELPMPASQLVSCEIKQVHRKLKEQPTKRYSPKTEYRDKVEAIALGLINQQFSKPTLKGSDPEVNYLRRRFFVSEEGQEYKQQRFKAWDAFWREVYNHVIQVYRTT